MMANPPLGRRPPVRPRGSAGRADCSIIASLCDYARALPSSPVPTRSLAPAQPSLDELRRMRRRIAKYHHFDEITADDDDDDDTDADAIMEGHGDDSRDDTGPDHDHDTHLGHHHPMDDVDEVPLATLMANHPGPEAYGYHAGQELQIDVSNILFSQRSVNKHMQFGKVGQRRYAFQSVVRMLRDLHMGYLNPRSPSFPRLEVVPVMAGEDCNGHLFVSQDNRRLMALRAFQSWHWDQRVCVRCIVARHRIMFNSETSGLGIATRGDGDWRDRHELLFQE